MRLLAALLALVTTTANAEMSTWKMYLIHANGSVHLQTHTEPRYAGAAIRYDSKEGCTDLGVKIIAAAKDYPTRYVGFFCEEEKIGQKPTSRNGAGGGAVAGVKKLVCIDPDVASQMSRASDLAKKYRDSNPEMAKEYEAMVEFCKSSGFASKKIFVFESNELEKDEGIAEYTSIYGCGLNVEETTRVRMTPMLSVISFYEVPGGIKHQQINVDRKTLSAGEGTDRSLTCHIEAIDTTQNRI